MQFDGSSDRLNITQSWTTTSTYTLEAWVTIPSVTSALNKYIFYMSLGSTTLGLQVINSSGNVFQFDLPGGGCSGSPWTNNTTVLTDGAKYHIAFSHDGTWGRTFLNGTQELQTSSGSVAGCSQGTTVIGSNTGPGYFPGTIDEIRLSDVARYTTNFTPPTGPFADDASTVLLFHFEETGGTIPASNPAATFSVTGSPISVSSPFP